MNPASTAPHGDAGMPHCEHLPRGKRLPRGERLPRRSRHERAVVLGPLGLATAATVFGLGEDILAPVWLAALAWTILASFALALHEGLQRGDWSAFRDCAREPEREEELEEDLRVGGYAFMRERDDVLANRDPRRSADARHDLS
ncbi:MAG: hypothetical protein F4133_04040 [Gammaproteobacteria bacterium]|nr:hypothetical protein [Gammaproteobacteria bacterium]